MQSNNMENKAVELRAGVIMSDARKIAFQAEITDSDEDTILAAIDREYDETHIHSKILFHLFTRQCRDDSNSYLKLFLRRIGIDESLLAEKWTPYREKTFWDGRIDFVFECRDFIIAMEMKIYASDGENQVERYEGFCRSRNKDYLIVYLSPYDDRLSEQSRGNVSDDRLKEITFRSEILEWLDECLKHCEPNGYMYSYIMQYIGTVRRITGLQEDTEGVDEMKALITDTESALAAKLLISGLNDKISDIFEEYMMKLSEYIEKNTGVSCFHKEDEFKALMEQTKRMYPGFIMTIDSKKIAGERYEFDFYVELGDYLYAGMGFHIRVDEENFEWVELEDMIETDVKFYDKWVKRIEKLDVPDMKISRLSYWFPIYSTTGEKYYFKDMNDPVLELIDSMDIQVEYAGEYLVNQIINPLLSYVRG